MHTYLHKKFYHIINALLESKQLCSIVIAISGGQDSLCLIKLMQDFSKEYKSILRISYIYIDHQWKKDSKKQVEHLINLIKIRQEKIYIYQMQNITKSELAARNLRYQILIKHATIYKYSIIMTAHTSTDKIETFLQQLIRGTSIDGVTSLTKKRQLNQHIQIIRPLISFTRSEITWFCRKFMLPIWSDISNYEYNISRNRLRNELLPYLNQYFLFNIEKQINCFIKISDIENEYIKQNAVKLYLISCHKANIALNCSLVKRQHIALQARTLQIFVYHNFNKTLNRNILNKLVFQVQTLNRDYSVITWENLNIKKHNNWLYIY